MADCELQPYTKLKKGQVSKICIVVGDPARAELVASLSDSSTPINFNKEYKSFDCVIKGVHFTACSHGVGNPSAAICFEELIKCGAKCIIRAGTSGYLQKGMNQGEIFISHGAVREEGVTNMYVDESFPAMPTPEVFNALMNSAKNLNLVHHSGLSITSDVFYNTPKMLDQMAKYAECGAKSISMEESTLFLICAKNNIWSGVVQIFDGTPLSWIAQDYDPHGSNVANAKKNMINVCLDAIPTLYKQLE